jgi:hypothetical protein
MLPFPTLLQLARTSRVRRWHESTDNARNAQSLSPRRC